MAGKAQHRSNAQWHCEDLQRRLAPEAAVSRPRLFCGQVLTPLSRCASSPQGDAARAAGRPLHGGRWPQPRLWDAPRVNIAR